MEKTETKPEEKKEEKKDLKLIERKIEGFYLEKNVEAMKKLGWDKPEQGEEKSMIDRIKAAPNTKIKIDPAIILSGVKNPLLTFYIGFSTKHLYTAMTRKKKISKVFIIVEPNLSAFKELISTEDITDLLLNPDIGFILGTSGDILIPKVFKELTKPIYGSNVSRSTIMDNMTSIVDPFQYTTPELQKLGKELMDIVEEAKQQLRLSMGCSDDQFIRFEMMVENKNNMFNSWNMTGLWDKFKDIPAIVLGGGPSLDEFIAAYKAIPKLKNAIIIASDAVLFKLLSNGIKPHLVTRCERKLTNIFKGITKEMTKGIYYCSYPWTPPAFFNLFEDSFYLFRQNGVCLFTEIKHAFVDGGVSAGNAALELAIDLGCRNILLSGIDLCEIDGKTHTSDTQVEFNLEKSKAKSAIKIKCNDGTERDSIAVWNRCLNEYAQSVDKWTRKGKKINVINTSTKGAIVPLTQHKTWEQTKELYFNYNISISEMLEKHRRKLTQEEKDVFTNKMKDVLPKLKEYLNITEIAIGLGEDAKRTAEREITKLVNHMKETIEKPYDLVKALRGNAHNYDKLWSNMSDSYDQNFKNKLYNDQLFRLLIFDVLQLDLYHCENACSSLANNVEFSDERHFAYASIMKEFALKVKHYLKEFIRIIEAVI